MVGIFALSDLAILLVDTTTANIEINIKGRTNMILYITSVNRGFACQPVLDIMKVIVGK